MSTSDFTEGLGIAFLGILLLFTAWRNNQLHVKFEWPNSSTSSTVISTLLVLGCGYFAREIFNPDPSNIYKIIGEPFRIHPLLLRTKLYKFEDQLLKTVGLSAEQTFERIMGKDGMQLSYAALGSLVFTHPYAESLSQLRIPMISALSKSYATMGVLISIGYTMPNREIWKKWGVIALVAVGVIQLFCLTNLQFLNLEGNDTLLEFTNRYKATAFVTILTGIIFIGEAKAPTQNEILLQTVRFLQVIPRSFLFDNVSRIWIDRLSGSLMLISLTLGYDL
ncbi:hypothetical protein K450DRAFT_228617 [Umbelopsis ramanniana AG]|uniref:Uncharacterized protein n=1 Tax=Umbelopsis ramanniana AG TaxID=1314678 RepID=A0AAD5EF98_UMBRA|nr:uncharacterized protein K450DRAFT_228617 [Umbelopsis ramanniana AG]KAI8582367.1 hypothetical protein K450DRAFT_228617 [Umbelopsis ramanniana AG]